MFKKKSVTLLVSLALLLCAAVGGTLAFIIDSTTPIENIFNPSEVTTTVTEDTEGSVKSNVMITNTGDTEAYIRAAVVITWQDAQGNIYGKPPVEGTDYTISYNKAGWLQDADGFYYWTEPVAGKVVTDSGMTYSSTDTLITSCVPVAGKAPEGYKLAVEIIGSAIQSVPETVVEDAWNVTVEDGIITG